MRYLLSPSGIAVGPILLTIAILAVLAAAMASTVNMLYSATASEKPRTLAAAILDNATQIKYAVSRVMGLGCSETQLNFAATGSSIGANSNAPADKHCNIFDAAGGGLVFRELLPDMCSSGTCNHGVSGGDVVPGIGSSNPDLIWLSYYVRQDVCNQINSLLGLVTGSTSTGIGNYGFAGTFSSSTTLNAAYTGLPAGCVPQGANYIFYMTLLAR